MILRKPYVFLIQHFKKIHIAMFIMAAYLVFCSNTIFSFLNEYLSSNRVVLGQELLKNNFNFLIFIIPSVILVMVFAVLSLMATKKKPITFYIFNIIVYLSLIVFYNYSYSVIGQMEIKILDLRTIKLLRDIFMILLGGQLISAIIFFVRATGFDIKKFDFGQDLQELQIDEKDREEFEVNVEFDSDLAKRNWTRRIREFKYFYVENKLLIWVSSFVVTLLLIFGLWYFFADKSVFVKQGSNFRTSDLIINVKNSYITTLDYRGRVVEKDSAFVILELDVKSKTDQKQILEVK